MEHLFAPWRMEYIGQPPDKGCLFCRVRTAPESEDRANLVVCRAPAAIVMMNRYPYNSGHLMIAPAAHVADVSELDDESALALVRALGHATSVLNALMGPEGFNVGANVGRAAGAGIPDHFHLHLVPRWTGDTNFMPVLGEVKVVNEHLDRTWERLSAGFRPS